jgi:hypothetical protein
MSNNINLETEYTTTPVTISRKCKPSGKPSIFRCSLKEYKTLPGVKVDIWLSKNANTKYIGAGSILNYETDENINGEGLSVFEVDNVSSSSFQQCFVDNNNFRVPQFIGNREIELFWTTDPLPDTPKKFNKEKYEFTRYCCYTLQAGTQLPDNWVLIFDKKETDKSGREWTHGLLKRKDNCQVEVSYYHDKNMSAIFNELDTLDWFIHCHQLSSSRTEELYNTLKAGAGPQPDKHFKDPECERLYHIFWDFQNESCGDRDRTTVNNIMKLLVGNDLTSLSRSLNIDSECFDLFKLFSEWVEDQIENDEYDELEIEKIKSSLSVIQSGFDKPLSENNEKT